MVRTTIALPEPYLKIAHNMKLNVSEICRRALKAEIERRRAAARARRERATPIESHGRPPDHVPGVPQDFREKG